MSKCKTATTSVLAVFFLVGVASAYALEPEWQENQQVDKTVFRDVITIPAFRIDVPMVVELPVPEEVAKSPVLVEDSEGSVQRAYIKQYSELVEKEEYVTTQFTSDFTQQALVDGDKSTKVSFPFEEKVENKAEVNISASPFYDETVTASGITFDVAENATLPSTVTIRAQTPGSSAVQLVVAKRPVSGRIISFPSTTAYNFMIEFGLEQPLHLSEIALIQKGAVVHTYGIRFLAEPGETYTAYLNPEGPYGPMKRNEANLTSDINVLQILEGGTASPQPNPQYERLDIDGDGVPDEFDNCPRTPNTEQRDVNRNSKGDACEDFDRDGVMTSNDNCPNVPNRLQKDTDADGVGDECDREESRMTERNPWIPWFGMGVAAVVLLSLFIVTVRSRPHEQEGGENEQEKDNDNQENEQSQT